jgi:hypothetical protein
VTGAPVETVTAGGGSLVRPAAVPLDAPYAEHSKAPATWAAYRRDWRQWTAWLDGLGVRPDDATPSHVAAFAADLADAQKAPTVCRKVASIGAMYRVAGRRSPTRDDVVRTTLAGIRRNLGTKPRRAAPLTADLLRQVVAGLDPARLADCRDASLLLVGFALAARRSELVGLRPRGRLPGCDLRLRRDVHKCELPQQLHVFPSDVRSPRQLRGGAVQPRRNIH